MTRPDAHVEVIDPELGAPMSARPEPGRLRPRTVIVALAGTLGLAAFVATVAHDDPPPPPPEPEPALGMFELDRIDLFGSPRADETSFPLFGRSWGQTLLFAQRLGIVAVDLDSGAQRIWLPRDDSFAPGGWNGVSFVDGTPYVSFGWGGVARVGGRGPEPVIPESDPGMRQGGVYGEYGLRLGLDADDLLTYELTHLPSGALVDVADARRFAVLGSRVLIERDGKIEVGTPDGGSRNWAAGELLAAGPAAVVWRECPQPDCATWAGTVDHPTARSIGVDMDRTIESHRLALWLGPFTLPVLSPGGRYAPGIIAGAQTGPGLIDLVDGDTIATLAPLQWIDDLSTIITLVEPTVALIDTDTGEVARIPLLEGAGARKGTLVTVVATDELPDLPTIE